MKPLLHSLFRIYICFQAPLTPLWTWRQQDPPKRLYLPHHYSVSSETLVSYHVTIRREHI